MAARAHEEAASPLMAGGLPLRESIADAAADWLTLFMSGEVQPADRERWRQWRAAHADHERAWQHIEAVTGRLRLMEPQGAYQALSPYAGPGRRSALRVLLWSGVALGAGFVALRQPGVQQLVAEHRSGTGEQKRVTLADGSQLLLNTATAVNVRFSAQRRLVHLVRGEILVTTAHALHGSRDARPFVVQTAQGLIEALGTRFAVRETAEGQTRVAVLESAVDILPRAGSPQRLQAGESLWFSATGALGPPAAITDDAAEAAWTQGQIVAEQMRLQDFLAEVARYRPGMLRCTAAVAGLHVSGVFPLDNTDAILNALTQVLPVQVQLRTRYWVTVDARDSTR